MISCTGIVNSRFSSNSYILSHQDYNNVWLIDPGDVQAVFTWMTEEHKNQLSGILLTHTHFDHIYGINDLLERYPACPVYVVAEFGREALFDAKKNASRYSEYGPVVLKENANVQIFAPVIYLWPEVSMRIIHTPGHSEDSACFVLDKMIFTGDTLIKNVKTITKLRGGSVEKLKLSMTMLSQFKDKGFVVYPGHNESFCLDGYDLNKSCCLCENSPKEIF